MKTTSYHVDSDGFYGEFGGAFIPEMLYPNTEELRNTYLEISSRPEFQLEFKALLKDYVGRPTPLFLPRVYRRNTKQKSTSNEKTFVTPERTK